MIMTPNRQRTVLTASILLGLCAACGSTKSSTSPEDSERWLEPSPTYQREIDDRAARVPYLQRPEDFIETISFFVNAGETAYPTLLRLAADPNPKVASTALAAIGETRDARLVKDLQELPWPPVAERKLTYERARCHVKLGDWKPISILVDGLEDQEVLARGQCFKALRNSTNETFDYHPQGTDEERAEAVKRWRAWLVERDLDQMR